MNGVNKFMLMLIAMVAIMLIAVGIDKGYEFYQDVKWEKERVAAYEQAKAEVETMQETIQTLSQNPEELFAYIEENELNYVEIKTVQESVAEETVVPGAEAFSSGWFSEDEGELSEETADESKSGSMSEGTAAENTVSENTAVEETISENSVPESSVSENNAPESSVSENSVSENSVSGNSVSENTVTVSGNDLIGKEVCASYEATIRTNAADKEIIAGNQYDFSNVKIACLGDSLTAATNLIHEENYAQMTYPYFLKQTLGAEEVVNLGIGGSSVGRYWDQAFVDRYREIPNDTDLIIVMGGTNDGFCATRKELGTLEERMPRTFAGDLDELLRGLKENYPEAEIVLVTPLSNVLHDMLRKKNEALLPQSMFTDMMEKLALEYGVNYIDLYHTNFLDTHDAAIIHNFMPDGVHGNASGYQLLAEHIAAQIVGIYAEKEE